MIRQECLTNTIWPDHAQTIKKSNKVAMNHLRHSLYSDYSSGYFKLEEIEWKDHFPVHSELIPFENRTKRIIKALEQEKAQANKKILDQ